MERHSSFSSFLHRLVPLALVAGIGLTTQFVVRHTLPSPNQGAFKSELDKKSGLSGFEAIAPTSATFTGGLPVPGHVGEGLDDAHELSATDAPTATASTGNCIAPPRRLQRSRTRTRRLLPMTRRTFGERDELQGLSFGRISPGWIAVVDEEATEDSDTGDALLLMPIAPVLIANQLRGTTTLSVELLIPEGFEVEIEDDGETILLRDRNNLTLLVRAHLRVRDENGDEERGRARNEQGRVRVECPVPRDCLVRIETRPEEHAEEPPTPPADRDAEPPDTRDSKLRDADERPTDSKPGKP